MRRVYKMLDDEEWNENRRKRNRVYGKTYREKRKLSSERHGKRHEYMKEYRASMTPEQHNKKKKSHAIWREKNKDKVKELKREYRKKVIKLTPVKYLVQRVGYNARKKGITFNLVPEDFAIPSHCPVLGIPIIYPAPIHTYGLPTFDRIRPELGYVKGNVRIISWRANNLKSNCTDPAELRAVADYIEREMEK